MPTSRTKEPQYDVVFDLAQNEGLQTFGLMSSRAWRDDPRRLGFMLARYKFVARMMTGMPRVLEVGCADGFATRVVRQAVGHVVATDFDPVFIQQNLAQPAGRWPVEYRVHNMAAGPLAEEFDGAYALDVLEHIPAAEEDAFLGNIARSLAPRGVCIIGMPSLNSQSYASPGSKAGHVNCKDEPGLRATMGRHFHNVFVFSMNDEVVHTGFTPMAHYLLALACGPKSH
ncbi:MAG: class I SAM-dependent methyltransferase [Verrucomicrobia bacterium]|nr:class I SAM-dependent methyltransferase [Verrucomicrobiota bacterium]